MEEIFKKILSLAVYAPSGDNMQPWRFVIQNQGLLLYNVPENDPTLYNYKQRAAYISHGALLENIAILAQSFGYSASFEYFPNPSDTNLTAKITLSETAKFDHPLLPYIKKRHTNRKLFRRTSLTPEQKEKFLDLFKEAKKVSLVLVEDNAGLKKAAAAVCQGDRMIFENGTVHNFLFSHIRWTQAEELKYKNGLYLKTMELAPPQVAAFKLFKNWSVMKIFNAIGFPKLAVKSNFKLYTNVSALAAFFIEDTEPKTFLELGQMLQRVWLTATSLGLSLHPLTGVPFFMQRIEENRAELLNGYQQDLIKKSYQTLAEVCGSGQKTMGFFCRLGHSEPPSGLSSRLDPEIKLLK